MQLNDMSIDTSKVRTVIFHMPDGQRFTINMNGLEEFVDLGPGRICDTSEIDGVVHFFPRGNA